MTDDFIKAAAEAAELACEQVFCGQKIMGPNWLEDVDLMPYLRRFAEAVLQAERQRSQAPPFDAYALFRLDDGSGCYLAPFLVSRELWGDAPALSQYVAHIMAVHMQFQAAKTARVWIMAPSGTQVLEVFDGEHYFKPKDSRPDHVCGDWPIEPLETPSAQTSV